MRSIALEAFQRTPSPSQQPRRTGKPRTLRSKDLLAAFSGQVAAFGQTKGGAYVAAAHLDDIALLMVTADGDPLIVKDTVESIFLLEEAGPVEPAPGEVDLRQFVTDGHFTGFWYVFEEEGLSFAILANSGYQIGLTEHDALTTFVKILNALKEGLQCKM